MNVSSPRTSACDSLVITWSLRCKTPLSLGWIRGRRTPVNYKMEGVVISMRVRTLCTQRHSHRWRDVTRQSIARGSERKTENAKRDKREVKGCCNSHLCSTKCTGVAVPEQESSFSRSGSARTGETVPHENKMERKKN